MSHAPPRRRFGLLLPQVLTYAVFNVAGFYEFHAMPANCGAVSAARCGQRYLFTFHTAVVLKCAAGQHNTLRRQQDGISAIMSSLALNLTD